MEKRIRYMATGDYCHFSMLALNRQKLRDL